MCNIAGYVGSKEAAPILIEMIKKQEGFYGGYYTGIATIDNGRIYHSKLTGDLENLIKNTDAQKLPGTVGIMHSRSKSGGGNEWAHPFVGVVNGNVECAYIANGDSGCFMEKMPQNNCLAKELLDEGYALSVQTLENPNPSYPMVKEGESVHMSDVMCQLILRNIMANLAPCDAMEKAYSDCPGEIVGLLLSLSKPDAIVWSRVNMPVFAAVAPHGVYLASTPIAFPDDASEPQLLPPCSTGYVYADSLYVKPFKKNIAKVARIYPETIVKAYEKICKRLRDGRADIPELNEAIETLFEKSDCTPSYAVVYEILYSLKEAGLLKIDVENVPGEAENLSAPKFYMSILE